MDTSKLGELEQEFIEFIIRINKRNGYELTYFEYLVDGFGFPKLHMTYLKKKK